MNPAQLRGEALARWYRRSPEEIEEERSLREQAEYDEFFGGLGASNPNDTWEEARVAQPRVRIVEPPSARPIAGGRAARGMPAEGEPRAPGSPGSFFGTHSTRYVNANVPAPLHLVEPSGVKVGYYALGDGTIESADEVERIYAEQKRLIDGNDEAQPAERVRVGDRLPDGQIPRAQVLTKGERELDPTCHPYGGWELDPQYPRYSKRTQRYEEQITKAPGLDYVVRAPGEKAVKFDGCAVWDPRRQLLEAKGSGRAAILQFLGKLGRSSKMLESDTEQAKRQIRAAQGRPLQWHAAPVP